MAAEDEVRMSPKELKRVHVIEQVRAGRLKSVRAAAVLGLSGRQFRRLVQRVQAEGPRGLVHRSRGRPSNRRLPAAVKARVLRRFQTTYADFGPTLASEKLAERQGVAISRETLRGWLKAARVPYPRRRARPHRHWRPRRAHRGELVQVDGSHHAWLEARGPAGVLMVYIDDASSTVFARLYDHEGTVPALDSFGRYVAQYGLPQAVYTDKHSTYRTPAPPTVEDQLHARRPQSQFERSLGELGVDVIHAHSPQAKGRVERVFRTFQDRLIKELRLAQIATVEAANAWLATYLPRYNQRFGVPPTEAADLHRPSPGPQRLAGTLCLKSARTVRRDGTLVYEGQWYQLDESRRPPRVMVEERLDGERVLTAGGHRLQAHPIPGPPPRMVAPRPPSASPRAPMKPGRDHPWKRRPFKAPGPVLKAARP